MEKRFWSRRIRDAVPYTPGEQPKDRSFIKLNTNECPYPPSPKALEAIRQAADDSLRLYPDPECLDLRRALAEKAAGRTQIVVTQRVTSAMSSDQIFVMDGGRLVDSGTHRELLERCKVYREIYLSQTGGERR